VVRSNVEMPFYRSVGQFGEGGRWRRCGFNASVSPRERRRQDEMLLEDEAEAASSSWLYGKEA
jgi:hypothetical protein